MSRSRSASSLCAVLFAALCCSTAAESQLRRLPHKLSHQQRSALQQNEVSPLHRRSLQQSESVSAEFVFPGEVCSALRVEFVYAQSKFLS